MKELGRILNAVTHNKVVISSVIVPRTITLSGVTVCCLAVSK